MRVRPDGPELLDAALGLLETAIVPCLHGDPRDAAAAVVETLACIGKRDAVNARTIADDIAALERAHEQMRGEILEALPAERRYDARMIAKAIAVAARRLANGSDFERSEYARLTSLFGESTEGAADQDEIRCALQTLNDRLCARIRAGAADAGTADYKATLAHLEASTNEALAESNPEYRRRGAVRAAQRSHEPAADHLYAWLEFGGLIGDAMVASGNATFATQVGFVGWFTRRIASNPNVPMLAVEGAHQAHDLSVAIADTSSAFMMLALAPLRFRWAEHRNAVRFP